MLFPWQSSSLFTEMQNTSWPSFNLNCLWTTTTLTSLPPGLRSCVFSAEQIEATRGRKLPLVGGNPERNTKRRKQTCALYSVFSRGAGSLVHESIGVAQSCSSCLNRSVTGCGFRKPFFLRGRRPLPCLLCSQRGEGAGSASSLSQECSAIWEWQQPQHVRIQQRPLWLCTSQINNTHSQASYFLTCWAVWKHWPKIESR